MRTFGGEGKDAGRREEEEWMRELMDGAVGRVCVPLRVRSSLQFGGLVRARAHLDFLLLLYVTCSC